MSTSPASHTEPNRALVQRFIAAMSSHDIDAAAALVAPGLLNHVAAPQAQGREGLRRIAAKLFLAFPDVHYEVHDVIAEGDRVACRLSFHGTQSGEMTFLTLARPASGRRVEHVSELHLFRIENGLIAELWACRDEISYRRQLGVEA